MSLYLGIDVGGSFLKGAVLDTGSETVGPITRWTGPDLKFSTNGGATIEPVELIDAVKRLISSLIDEEKNYEGILITGQMHGFIMVDKEGRPQTEVVTWRDSLRESAGSPESSQILRELLGEKLLSEVGSELREGIPLAGIFTRLRIGSRFENATPHSLISFIAHGLCESFREPVMHNSDAAAHGFLNIETNAWHYSLLEECGITSLRLPGVTTNMDRVGVCRNTQLPVFVAVGDHQAALYGVGLKEGELSLNIATGSQVSIISKTPSTTCQSRPFFGNRYLATVTHIPAGRSLNVLLGLVGELTNKSDDELWAEVCSACEKQPQTDLKMSLGFFSDAQGSEGSIKHIRENEFNVGALFNSAAFAMADNYDYFARVVSQGLIPEKVVLSGGLVSRFKPLRTAIMAKFGRSIIREVPTEDSSISGLHLLAKDIVQ
jgi:xylulokinase